MIGNEESVAVDWLNSSGEMGKVIRSMDWSKTPLGPIESWPQSLRTTVSLCLASNFPINIIWGPGRVQIYNDGYWPICGDKHPHSMGQDFKECWLSAWDAVGEPLERASAGETTFLENRRMFLDRNGYLEETFFTFSFSPIRDETGGVGGLFHPVTELTQQTLTERRLKVLRDLAENTADAKTIEEVCRLSAQALAAHELDLPFTLFYRLDTDSKQAHLVSMTGLAPGSAACPTVIDLEASPELWALADVARWSPADQESSGQARQVDDLEQRFGSLECSPYPESSKSAIVVPIALPRLAHAWGVFVAGVSPRRALDEAYQTFYTLLGKSVTTAITNAHAYEEERKRAEALAELGRAKTAFFNNVSHEFRTPLTLMLGPAEDALTDRDDPLSPHQRQRIEVMQRNGLRLLKLVNTLLDFSRIESDRVQTVYQPTDLATFTAELASVFRSVIEKANLRLVVDCPPLPQPIYVDREMWEKIVLNLLSNAFKFTFMGEITVRLHPVGERVELAVQDTGIGIPAAEIGRLFERFHRVKGSRGRTFEGSGIGLSLVQELVKLHGGTVQVKSVEGEGSCFTVSIPTGSAHLPQEQIGATRTITSTAMGASPYVEEALQWVPQEEGEKYFQNSPTLPLSHSSTPSSARILLVDDNADMRDYVRRLLSERWQVETAANGAIALNLIQQQLPDLVLTDVMMPEVDGFQVLNALRGNPATKSIPIILLSARAGEEATIEGLEAGADDYLIKPFFARELVARVETQLQMSRLRQEQSANRFKNEFLMTVTHELQAPLAAILGWSRLLQTKSFDQTTITRALATIERNATIEAKLVKDLLDISSILSGKLRINYPNLPDG
jgi:signal transduction histidine kinase